MYPCNADGYDNPNSECCRDTSCTVTYAELHMRLPEARRPAV